MLRLLINSLDGSVAVALADGNDILKVALDDTPDKSLSIDQAFRSLQQPQPEEIVIISGPGNFTAIRAAIGYARGLALAYDIKSRGIDIFTVDYALISDAPQDAVLCRDARGGRYYQAAFKDGILYDVTLTTAPSKNIYSAEELPFDYHPITRRGDLRMNALAMCAERDLGTYPAQAFYIRSANAALPSDPPLKILDL